MSHTIYYFSGTGNSLRTARALAEKITNTRVKNIALLHNQTGSIEKTESAQDPTRDDQANRTKIGFVFPTYAYGLPRMVKEFAETVPIPENAYIFAVASNCGIPGPVLKQLNKILKKRGRKLQSGFAVLDPSSSLINDPENDSIQKLMISLNRGAMPGPSSSRIDEIADAVNNEHKASIEASNRRANFLGGLLYPLAMKRFKSSGKEFHANESCTGCGMCVQVCPRNNISIVDGKPEWGEDCELCHACIQWCTKSSIQYRELTENRPRYTNPEVCLRDMKLREHKEAHCGG